MPARYTEKQNSIVKIDGRILGMIEKMDEKTAKSLERDFRYYTKVLVPDNYQVGKIWFF